MKNFIRANNVTAVAQKCDCDCDCGLFSVEVTTATGRGFFREMTSNKIIPILEELLKYPDSPVIRALFPQLKERSPKWYEQDN